MGSSSDGGTGAADGQGLAGEVLARLRPAPFWDFLGCELVDAAPGTATVRLPARVEYGRSSNTGDGTAHGGLLATLADMTAACALMTVLAPDEARTTIDLTVHYLGPARGDLLATGAVRRRGGRTAVIDVDITAGSDEPVAIGRATFAVLRRT